jgi:hypothetical protein
LPRYFDYCSITLLVIALLRFSLSLSFGLGKFDVSRHLSIPLYSTILLFCQTSIHHSLLCSFFNYYFCRIGTNIWLSFFIFGKLSFPIFLFFIIFTFTYTCIYYGPPPPNTPLLCYELYWFFLMSNFSFHWYFIPFSVLHFLYFVQTFIISFLQQALCLFWASFSSPLICKCSC